MKRYKVVQWATVGMGRNCLRALIDHPAMDLVGVYVYGAEKAGKDAGEIARRAPTAVLATRDVEEILALDADVVVHAAQLAPPYGSHDADILRLLASGKNVISINGYSQPQHWGGERLQALEAACAQGNIECLLPRPICRSVPVPLPRAASVTSTGAGTASSRARRGSRCLSTGTWKRPTWTNRSRRCGVSMWRGSQA